MGRLHPVLLHVLPQPLPRNPCTCDCCRYSLCSPPPAPPSSPLPSLPKLATRALPIISSHRRMPGADGTTSVTWLEADDDAARPRPWPQADPRSDRTPARLLPLLLVPPLLLLLLLPALLALALLLPFLPGDGSREAPPLPLLPLLPALPSFRPGDGRRKAPLTESPMRPTVSTMLFAASSFGKEGGAAGDEVGEGAEGSDPDPDPVVGVDPELDPTAVSDGPWSMSDRG